MGLLSKTLFTALSSSMRTLEESANELATLCTTDNIAKVVDAQMKNAKKLVEEMSAKIINLGDNTVFSIDFDKTTEKVTDINYHDGNKLTVTVCSLDGQTSRTSSFTVNGNYGDISVLNMRQTYDEKNKKLNFIFKKAESADANTTDKHETETSGNETNNDFAEPQFEDVSATSAPSPSPLASITENLSRWVSTPTAKETEQIDKVKEKKSKLIEQVLDYHKNGWSNRKIAKEIGVSDKTVAKWLKGASN